MKASTRGKRNRARGKAWELYVRKDLESKGWVVFRNSNDVVFGNIVQGDLSSKQLGELKVLMKKNKDKACFIGADVSVEKVGKFVQTTGHWNNFLHRIVVSQSGFPDFLAIKTIRKTIVLGTSQFGDTQTGCRDYFVVQFVECKSGELGLDKAEKAKCEWIISNLHIPVIIAKKIKVGRKIEVTYEEFKKT